MKNGVHHYKKLIEEINEMTTFTIRKINIVKLLHHNAAQKALRTVRRQYRPKMGAMMCISLHFELFVLRYIS